MFTKWRANKSRQKLQLICPHEYHIVSEYRDCDMYDCWDMCDIYCPLCELEKSVTPKVANKVLAKQEVRKQYDENFLIR
ncbi:hypothetical protein [Psychrobacillus phage Perkons]|nr:hypothetical protein [Psychrobacillus phage Perkons]